MSQRGIRETFESSEVSHGLVPPQALDLEEAVLGAIMLQSDCVNEVLSILQPEHFYKTEHQKIFQAISQLAEKDSAIDILTVTEKCKSNGTLFDIGGALVICDLTERVASSANVEFHANIIKDKALAREQAKFALEVHKMSFLEAQDPFETNEFISMGSERLASSMSFIKRPSNSELVREVIETAENAKKNGGIIGLTTGIPAKDKITKGLQGKKLYIKAGRPAMGKLQPLTEPVLTPDGWVLMGDVKVGSFVSCPVSGNPIEVTKVNPQENLDIYKITFGDGSHTECCNDHLWQIQTAEDILNGTNRVVDVNWMLERGVLDRRNRSKFRIPLTNPIEFTKKEPILDPYLLGLLIANGHIPEKRQVVLSCHSNDVENIFEIVKKLIPKDVTVKLDRQYGDVLARKIIFSSNIKKYLSQLGLLGKKSRLKFIPENHLYNSVESRKRMLSGLMDADGSCFVSKSRKSKQASYSTMSETLKDNIIELIKSLGGTAYASSETREKYYGGACWNIGLRVPFNPFTLKRKADVFDSIPYTNTLTKHIRSIEFLRKDKGQCIAVDSKDRLYVTRDYIVTHNSADALCEAIHIATVLHETVAVFSLEMGSMELMQRALSVITEIDADKIITGNLTIEEWHVINEKSSIITDSPLIIIDNIMSLIGIKAECRRLKEKHNLKAIFIDYIQLIEHSNGGNRETVVSEISRSLKLMAKRLDVPVIALAQLSRAVETRGGDKKPILSDLRESGSIEQDADVVEFLYRPEYYGIEQVDGFDNTVGLTFSLFAKNRGGSIGNIPMRFQKSLTKFIPWVEEFNSGSYKRQTVPDEAPVKSVMTKSNEFEDIDSLLDENDSQVF